MLELDLIEMRDCIQYADKKIRQFEDDYETHKKDLVISKSREEVLIKKLK